MVVVNINEGLGNQMFHYAFGQGLKRKGLDVYYSFKKLKYRKSYPHESLKLTSVFTNLQVKECNKIKFPWLFSPQIKGIGFLYRQLRKLDNIFLNNIYYFETKYGYTQIPEIKNNTNIIYSGHWQSEKYFKECEDEIRDQFQFLPFDEDKNIALSEKMQSENSVAIHIRKGKDYIDPLFVNICDKEYYLEAIEYIKKHVDNPVFYIFTDNPDWAKENFKDIPYTLVDWNTSNGEKSFRDMQLMTYAKHNIIANSTYSWWGAWLNPNTDKIVIAPKVFFNPINTFFSTSDIVPDKWIKI